MADRVFRTASAAFRVAALAALIAAGAFVLAAPIAASTALPAQAAGAAAAQDLPLAPKLAPKYQTWLRSEVPDIISEIERRVFLVLESDRERDLFIQEFWRQRDPSPGTARNEFKDEHYRRLEFADLRFGRRGRPGSGRMTDRGRFYVKLGPPFDVQRITTSEVYPCEIWTCHGRPHLGQPAVFRLLFYQPRAAGDYRLYDPMVNRPSELVTDPDRETNATYERLKGIEPVVFDDVEFPASWNTQDRQSYRILREYVSMDLTHLVFTIIPGSRDVFQSRVSANWLNRIEASPRLMVRPDYAEDFLKHRASVEVSYSVHNIGHRSKAWIFREPGGPFFVNYLLVPERLSMGAYEDTSSTDLRTSLRVTDPKGRTVFQQEKDCPLELSRDEMKLVESRTVHFIDAFPIMPGRFAATLLWENTASREFTTVDLGIQVPDGMTLSMSPLLLSRSIVKGLGDPSARQAFLVGDYQINPLIDNVFGPKDRLYVFVQLHGLPADLRESGTVEACVVRGAGAAADERRRGLRELDGTPEVLNIFETFALDGLEPGAWAIEIAVRDASGEVRLTSRETFTVSTAALPGTWVIGPSNPGPGDPAQDYLIGTQLLGLGRTEEALSAMSAVYRERPADLEFAAGYADGLVKAGRAAEALAVLRPLAAAGEESARYQTVRGDAALAAGEHREALDAYVKAMAIRGRTAEVLNTVGECHRALGEPEAAADAWRASLAINPDQPAIRRKLEELKKRPGPGLESLGCTPSSLEPRIQVPTHHDSKLDKDIEWRPVAAGFHGAPLIECGQVQATATERS